MSGVDLAVASLVIAVGSLLQGAVGFGANLVAVPLLVLIDPGFVPGPTQIAALALNILVAVRERKEGSLREVSWALAGRLPGTVLGVAALVALPASRLSVFFAVVILVGVALSAINLHLRPTPGTLFGAGAASGFMATTVSVGGPPMALVYQRSPGPVLRSVLARYFVVGIVISLVGLAVVGELGTEELVLGAILVPGTVIGFAFSGRLAPMLDRGRTRIAVLIVSGLSAVAIVIQQVA